MSKKIFSLNSVWALIAIVFGTGCCITREMINGTEPTVFYAYVLLWLTAIIAIWFGVHYEMRYHDAEYKAKQYADDYNVLLEKLNEDCARYEYKKLENEGTIKTLNHKLSEKNKTISSVSEKNTELNQKLNMLTNEYKELNHSLGQITDEMGQLTVSRNNLKNELEHVKLQYNKLKQEKERWQADTDIAVNDVRAEVNKKYVKEIEELNNEIEKLKIKTVSKDADLTKEKIEQDKKLAELIKKIEARNKEFLELMGHAYIIEPKDRKYYRYYNLKNEVYKLICVATNRDATNRPQVMVYQSMTDGSIWTLNANKFNSCISVKAAKDLGIPYKVGDALPPKFEEVSEEEAMEIAAR